MTVVDMRRRQTKTVEEIVAEIRRQFLEEEAAGRRVTSILAYQGELLIAVRKRVEADGGDWWRFYDENFGAFRSRKRAEALMRIGGAPDPEAAHEEEKADTRERVAAGRVERTVRSKEIEPKQEVARNLVQEAVELVRAMTPLQRRQFAAQYKRLVNVELEGSKAKPKRARQSRGNAKGHRRRRVRRS
jgi:hypothetical protein